MITTSAAYKTAVNADSRQWVPKVEVYFDGDSAAPVTFDGDDIISISLLEEAKADGDNPLGLVSSNELTVVFDNSTRQFTPTNTASSYYGKLKPNLLVKAWLGLTLPSAAIEYIPLGIFRCGDWSSPSSSLESTTTCYDALYALGNKNVPMMSVVADTTVANMFNYLLDALDLTAVTDYEIDGAIGQNLSVGFIPKGKVLPALQALALAGNCFVYADRYGVIQVKSNVITDDYVVAWTENDQIINVENPQKYLEAYSSVRVNYKRPTTSLLTTVLSIDNLVVPQGGLVLSDLDFSASPVSYVEQVRLLGAVNSAVSTVKFGAYTIDITITNASVEETVNLEVIGQSIEFAGSDYTLEDSSAVASFGERELPIESELIQELESAQSYADQLLQYVSDPLVNFELDARGDPAIEIGDVVQVTSTVDKIGATSIAITRTELQFDGGLQAKTQGRKVYTPYRWVYISPGFFVRMEV